MFLIQFYGARRPHAPQPGHGWTVGLTWTHPSSYGTAQEENRLQCLLRSFIYSFGLVALGEGIKVYKLGDYSGIRALNKP